MCEYISRFFGETIYIGAYSGRKGVESCSDGVDTKYFDGFVEIS